MRLASLDSLVDQAYAVRRFNAGLFTSFGLLAVVLACVGLAGTMAYAVSERTRELAVRVALGAEPGNLVLRVVGRGVALALGGVGLGLALGLPLTRFLDRLLYNVDPRDPAMLAVVSIALLAIAAVTSYIPARRVSRVDPVMVFRE
jgi:ABC-type antimicrobial peptide transport system permease subunit